jgi:hypothetical protein
VTGSPTIRTARPDEAEALLDLWREADAAPSVSDDVDSIRRLIARDPEAPLVADQDGVVVGSLIVGWDGWRAALYRLAVSPAAGAEASPRRSWRPPRGACAPSAPARSPPT